MLRAREVAIGALDRRRHAVQAETVSGVQGHPPALADRAGDRARNEQAGQPGLRIETRCYNPDVKSSTAMVPAIVPWFC